MHTRSQNVREIFTRDEISLQEVWGLLWAQRKYVIFCVVPFVILGIIAAKTSSPEYEAKCTLLTDKAGSSAQSSGSLMGLASLAGVSVPQADAGGSDMGPAIYGIVLNSKPFLIELANEPLRMHNSNETITLKKYFQKGIKPNLVIQAKDFILDLPGWVMRLFRSEKKDTASVPAVVKPVAPLAIQSDSLAGTTLTPDIRIVELNGADNSAASALLSRIKLTITGNQLILTVKMPEAWLSAQATQMVLDKFIKYVTKYKTGKQLETLNFLEARTAEAEQAYRRNQQRAAGFRDNNYGVIYQSIQSQEQVLQNEFTLSFALYNSLATQLQQARIQLKKDTPLFSLIEPVYVPSGPSEPVASKIILSYLFMGLVLGILIIVYQIVRQFFNKQPAS